MPTKCCWVIHVRQADQGTKNFNFSIVIHQFLDPAASSLSLHACMNQSSTVPFLPNFGTNRLTSALKHLSSSTRDRVDALSSHAQNSSNDRTQRVDAVVVIICMITCEFSLISMTSQAPLSLSLSISLSTTHNKSRTIYQALLRLV